jgi:hypothetical protein
MTQTLNNQTEEEHTTEHDMYCGEIVASREADHVMITVYKGNRRWYLTKYYWSICDEDWREENVRRISDNEAIEILKFIDEKE